MMRRILVMRSGGVGDFILTLPVFAALRRKYPGARIDVLGYPSIASLAVVSGYAETVLSIDRADLAPLFIRHDRLPRPLSGLLSGYDTLVCFLPDRDGVLAHNLAHPSRLCLFGPSSPLQRVHMTHQLYGALAPLGLIGHAPPPDVSPAPEDQTRVDGLLRKWGVPEGAAITAVHPGSGGRHKCWPPAAYAALIDHIAGRGHVPVITAGPADEAVVRQVQDALCMARPVLAAHLDLAALVALFTRCRCMVGNDSGITHLATATGVPTVALFGPTDPAVWGPRGGRVQIIWGDRCIQGDAGLQTWAASPPVFPEMTDIPVSRVIYAVDSMTGGA